MSVLSSKVASVTLQQKIASERSFYISYFVERYKVKYFDDRKKVVHFTWLSPWKPIVAPKAENKQKESKQGPTNGQKKVKQRPLRSEKLPPNKSVPSESKLEKLKETETKVSTRSQQAELQESKVDVDTQRGELQERKVVINMLQSELRERNVDINTQQAELLAINLGSDSQPAKPQDIKVGAKSQIAKLKDIQVGINSRQAKPKFANQVTKAQIDNEAPSKTSDLAKDASEKSSLIRRPRRILPKPKSVDTKNEDKTEDSKPQVLVMVFFCILKKDVVI